MSNEKTPAPKEKESEKPNYPPYADTTSVVVEHKDGTTVSCTYEYYKKHYEDSGAKVLHKYESPIDPRTLELERLLNPDGEEE